MHDPLITHAKGTQKGTPEDVPFPHSWVAVELGGGHGLWALISPEDEDRVRALKWHRWQPQGRPGVFYVKHSTKVRGRVQVTWLHRFILGVTDPAIKVDHIDGFGLNCMRYNLRIATSRQNSQHVVQSKNQTNGGFKGVYWNKRAKKWEAAIAAGLLKPDGKRKRLYLGIFADPEDAARAYDTAAVEHFGEFAALNFPALARTG